MRLRNVMKRYRGIYIREDGLRFLGEITAPDNDRVHLKVDPASPVRPGEVFRTEAGRRYLTLSKGESDFARTVYTLFELVEVDRELAWSRTRKVKDRVTGLEKDGVPEPLGTIRAHIERQDLITDLTRIDERRYVVTTAAALRVKDRIGDMVVTEVFFTRGVCKALAK